MKILIDTAFGKGQLAGLELWGVEFVRHLAEFDRSNRYIIYGYFWKNFQRRKSMVYVPEQRNFSLYVNRIPRQFVDFLESHNIGIIEKLTGEKKIDIFHGAGFFLPKLKKAKGIITIHGLDFKEQDAIWYGDRWYKHFPVYLKRADRIIAVSEYVRKKLVELYNLPEFKINVVYPGVRDRFTFSPEEKEGKTEGRQKPYIVCVATSVERKNLRRVLNTFYRLKDRYRDINLMLVGDKKMLLDSLKEQMENLKISERVKFPGYLNDEQLSLVYNRAMCLLFPSLYEGFGLPVLEAMACGCPVITSNVSAMPEIADDAGILVDPHSVDEITSAVERVLSDSTLREDMRQKGLNRAKEFSWEKAVQETLKVYEEICERR
jgi:glycosyltransferase involved in cell wall biosynthesis